MSFRVDNNNKLSNNNNLPYSNSTYVTTSNGQKFQVIAQHDNTLMPFSVNEALKNPMKKPNTPYQGYAYPPQQQLNHPTNFPIQQYSNNTNYPQNNNVNINQGQQIASWVQNQTSQASGDILYNKFKRLVNNYKSDSGVFKPNQAKYILQAFNNRKHNPRDFFVHMDNLPKSQCNGYQKYFIKAMALQALGGRSMSESIAVYNNPPPIGLKEDIDNEARKLIINGDIDFRGDPNIDQKDLIDIARGSNSSTQVVHLKGCLKLIELDQIKEFVKVYYEEGLYENGTARNIMNELRSMYTVSSFKVNLEELELNSIQDTLINTNNVNMVPDHLVKRVFRNIEQKINTPESQNGHPRGVLTKKDLDFINKYENRWDRKQQAKCYNIIQNFQEAIATHHSTLLANCHRVFLKEGANGVTTIDVEKLKKYITSGNENHRDFAAEFIVESKAGMMQIAEEHARWISLGDFGDFVSDTPELKSAFDLLSELDGIRGEAVDTATLNWIQSQNASAMTHPIIGIIGGGPTGLLSAIEMFAQGGSCILQEARSETPERTQIVRLDPLWTNKLKFYLGEKYYEYFIDPDTATGNISSDGFVECTTKHIEQRLKERIVELQSYLEDDPYARGPQTGTLIYQAAHKSGTIKEPVGVGGKYILTSEYQARYDRAMDKTNPPPLIKEEFEIDYLFDCSGKSSEYKRNNFISGDVTEGNPYAVASFLVDGKCDSYDQENHDFKRSYLVNDDMLNSFTDEVRSIIFNLSVDLVPQGNEYLTGLSKYSRDDGNGETTNIYETRTFINTSKGYDEFGDELPHNIVYVGMELPATVNKFLDEASKVYEDAISQTHDKDQIEKLKKEQGKFRKDIQLFWTMQVAKQQGLTRPRKEGDAPWVRKDIVDNKFLTSFPVAQEDIPNPFITRSSGNGASTLFEVALGDSCVSPHFMRYSGLTGARQHVQVMSKVINNHAMNGAPPNSQKTKSEINQQFKDISTFVLDRGKVFLKQKTESEKEKIFLDNLRKREKSLVRQFGVDGTAERARQQLSDYCQNKNSLINQYLDIKKNIHLQVKNSVNRNNGWQQVKYSRICNEIIAGLKADGSNFDQLVKEFEQNSDKTKNIWPLSNRQIANLRAICRIHCKSLK